MKLLIKINSFLLIILALTACGGLSLGIPISVVNNVNGVYICYGETSEVPCRPASAFACNSSNSSKKAYIDSYYSFGSEPTQKITVTVEANVTSGFGPLLGTTEHMVNGLCKTRNYRVVSAN